MKMKSDKLKFIETSRKVHTIGSTCPIATVDKDKVCDAELELADYLGTDIYHTGAITYDRQRKELNVAYNLPRPVNYQGSKIINVCLSCVYILFYQKEIVYIGESVNPNQRIGTHIKDKLFDGYRILPTNRRKQIAILLLSTTINPLAVEELAGFMVGLNESIENAIPDKYQSITSDNADYFEQEDESR